MRTVVESNQSRDVEAEAVLRLVLAKITQEQEDEIIAYMILEEIIQRQEAKAAKEGALQ